MKKMVEKKKLESGEAALIVSLYEGRLTVESGLRVLVERDMLDGEWAELWAVLNGKGLRK